MWYRLNHDGVIFTGSAPAGYLSSSCRAEEVAIYAGLDWVLQQQNLQRPRLRVHDDDTVLICTDSQSAIKELERGPLLQSTKLTSDIWGKLLLLLDVFHIRQVVFQYVASHCGVQKNERVDRVAAEALVALRDTQVRASIPLIAIKSVFKRVTREMFREQLNRNRHRFEILGDKPTDLKLSSQLSRNDEVTLAQLRVDECILLGKYRYERLKIGTPQCRWCNLVPETVKHVMQDCEEYPIVIVRIKLDCYSVKMLWEKPEIGLQFCREVNDTLTF